MRIRSILEGRAALCLAALLPPLLIAALIYKYGVDLPYSDEWLLAPIFFEYAEGNLAFRHLFALQNEYRQFFPNLVIIFMGWATRWDVRYEMWVSFLLAAITSFNIYRLGKLTFAGDDGRRIPAFLLSNLLIFSPAQHMNWQMGQQLIFFFPAACVTTCLVVARSGLSFWWRLALCACLSTVSTFSSANGFVCWLVVLPALLWSSGPRGERTRAAWGALAWAAGFAVNMAAYLNGYSKPASHPSLLDVLRHPLRGASFFLALLGSPLSGEAAALLLVALFVGLALLAAYLTAAMRLFRHGVRQARFCPLVVWLALGAYSILSACIVTLGRAGFGLEYAFSSRYMIFTLYLAVAVIHLIALGIVTPRPARASETMLARRAAIAWGAAAAVVALTVLASFIAVRQMRATRLHLLQEKACLLFVNVLPETCIGRRSMLGNISALPEWANRLDAMGFLRPALLKSDRVREFADEGEQGSTDHGTFDISNTGAGALMASGTATLARRGEPADAVVVAYEDTAGEARAFALAEVEGALEVFGRLRRPSARRDVRWRKIFKADEIPPQGVALSAWAFDAETGRARRIGEARPVRRDE